MEKLHSLKTFLKLVVRGGGCISHILPWIRHCCSMQVFLVLAYHTVTKSVDFLNYIMPCRRQFD